MGWYDRWVLSFVPTALAIIEVQLDKVEIRLKYKSILKKILQVADLIRPYADEL